MTIDKWIIFLVFFGIIIVTINFTCFVVNTDAEGFRGDIQKLAEDKVTDNIQSEYGLPTLDTFRVQRVESESWEEGKAWKVTGKWRVDSREYHDSTEYVCMAYGTYEVLIEYEGREDRYYANDCAMYNVKDLTVSVEYKRGQK